MNRNLPILLVALLAALSACAVPVPPSGGPEDTTAPSIVESVPEQGEVRVQEARISLTFSEPVERSTFARAWSITPDIPGPVDIAWNGRRVTLRFESALRPETTYILTLDTSLRDIRRVALGQPVTLAFATGARLNQGVLSGRIVDPVTGDDVAGMDVFAWAPSDTVGVSTPLYRSQSGRDGRFRMTNLRETDYVVAAFRDSDRDQQLDAGERFAAPASALIRADSAGSSLPDALYPIRPDTTAPTLLRVRARTARDLVLRFDESVSSSVAPTGWTVSDSAGTRSLPAVVFPGADPREWVARTDSLAPGAWRLMWTDSGPDAVTLSDSSGNPLAPGFWPFAVRGTEPPAREAAIQTVRPDSSIAGTGGYRTLWPSDRLEIVLTAPSEPGVAPPFTVQDTTGSRLDDITIRHLPSIWTLARRPEGPFIVAGADSMFRYVYAGDDQLGEVSGIIDSPGPVVLELRSDAATVLDTVVVPAGLQSFRVSRLPGGLQYAIRAFIDSDGNGAWTPGRAHPFRPAERLLFVDGTEPVRARWESARADTLRFDLR